MPLRFVRQAVANNTAQSLVLIIEFGAQRLAAVAARSSVFENAHYVNTYASNRLLDKASPFAGAKGTPNLQSVNELTGGASDDASRSIAHSITLLVSAIFGVRQGKAVRKAILVY